MTYKLLSDQDIDCESLPNGLTPGSYASRLEEQCRRANFLADALMLRSEPLPEGVIRALRYYQGKGEP